MKNTKNHKGERKGETDESRRQHEDVLLRQAFLELMAKKSSHLMQGLTAEERQLRPSSTLNARVRESIYPKRHTLSIYKPKRSIAKILAKVAVFAIIPLALFAIVHTRTARLVSPVRAEEVLYAKPKVLIAVSPVRGNVQVTENVTDYPAERLTEKILDFNRRLALPVIEKPLEDAQINEIQDSVMKQIRFEVISERGRYKLDKESGEVVAYSYFASSRGSYDEEQTNPESEAKAIAQAQIYKDKLGIGSDYVVGQVFPVQDIYHISFYKKENSGLLSEFDLYSFAIAMDSGELLAFSRKYVPLEKPRVDISPLSEAQALDSAQKKLPFLFEGKTDKPELYQSICLPNYLYDSWNTTYQSATFCRAAWVIKLNNPQEERIDYIFVDLYSGEMLGGDIVYVPLDASSDKP